MVKCWLRRLFVSSLVVLAGGAVWAQSDVFPLPSVVERLGDQFNLILTGADGVEVVWQLDDYIEQPRCLTHSLLVAEQGFFHSGTGFFHSGTDFLQSGSQFFHSGTVGGVVLGDNSYVQPRPVESILSETVPNYLSTGGSTHLTLAEILWLPPQPGDVVIVVLDDFGRDEQGMPILALSEQAFNLGVGAEELFRHLVNTGAISHGALVMHFLNALIAATNQYTLDASASSQARVVWNGSNDARLIVSAHNLRGHATEGLIDTDGIAAGLGASIESAHGLAGSENRTLRGVVINMSWVLLPCPTAEAFASSRDQFLTFEDYIEGLKALSPADSWILDEGLTPDDIVWILAWVGMENSLYRAISSYLGEATFLDDNVRIGFVAASGNFRLPYQMLPAAWPAVVGVGSPTRDAPPPPFSNAGEVIAPGAWFKLEPVLPWEAGSGGAISVAGTSYSAPIVSLFTAVDIASASRCTPYLFSGDPPGLASYPQLVPSWLADAAHGSNSKCVY